MSSTRDMQRRAAILSVAQNPRTARDEHLAMVEWLADLPLDERSSSLRSDAELDMLREVESADARKDVRAMTADKDGRPSLVTQSTIDMQVVTAPSRAMPLAKNGKSIEDAPTVREYHKRTATADRATATASFTADRELSVAVKRAAAQGGVDAEHRRSARLDHDEMALAPYWDGSCGWNRDKDGTALTRKRAPSAFNGPERWAIRDARAQRTVYISVCDENGVLLRTEINPTVGAGALLSVREEVCSYGFPPTDATAGEYVGTHATAAAAAIKRAVRAKELEDVNRRARELARAEGRLPRKRGKKR